MDEGGEGGGGKADQKWGNGPLGRAIQGMLAVMPHGGTRESATPFAGTDTLLRCRVSLYDEADVELTEEVTVGVSPMDTMGNINGITLAQVTPQTLSPEP